PAYFLNANPVLTVYGVNIPVHILFSSQTVGTQFSAFNRFGLSPQYKWAKLHLGWRSLDFSQFTLNGQQILGAGFTLDPGKFRLAFMQGRFNEAVTNISTFNNLNNHSSVFNRKGFAAKIGYGSDAHFLEFTYLQAKDQIGRAHV